MNKNDYRRLIDLIQNLQAECTYFKTLINEFENCINKIHPDSEVLKLLKNLSKHIN